MKIAFIPRYDRRAASSRLRCYALAEAMNQHGMAEAVVGNWPSGADAVVLQKSVTERHFVETGARRIYDVDDIIEHPPRRLISQWAQIITTDTELRAQGIREWFRGPVHVIPDPIDYEDGPPKPPNPEARRGIVWFGNWPNFASVRDVMKQYHAGGERIGAISDLTPEKAQCPGLEIIPWRLETFTAELRRWSHCALSHAGADQCKSENKLVAAIYQGVMPIYVKGPAYEALIRDMLGLDTAAAQSYVWDRYRAEVIARRALEVYSA